MEGQDSFVMREPEDAEVEFGEDGEDVVVVVVADAGAGTIRMQIYTQPIRGVQS